MQLFELQVQLDVFFQGTPFSVERQTGRQMMTIQIWIFGIQNEMSLSLHTIDHICSL